MSRCRRSCARRCAPTRRPLPAAHEGRGRSHYRAGPRSALCGRHRRRARGAAYLDAAACLPSPRPLPGHRRRCSGGDWHPSRPSFLVPYAALAKLVRGKLCAALAKRCPGLALPKAIWQKRWVVHARPGAKVRRRCCAIWPAMCSAPPSPTTGLPASMRLASPSATSIAPRTAGA